MHTCSPGRLYYAIPATATLPEPMNIPVLTRTMDHQEFYDISIPIEIELQVYDNPSLLFRIEDQSRPGEYVYQWMVDVTFNLPEITMVEYLLNLNTFIGRRVNISYAFATENGLSEYSEPAVVQVPGNLIRWTRCPWNYLLVFADQCVAVELIQSEVDISASLDERAGFFTHYVLNVSWCPSTCTLMETS